MLWQLTNEALRSLIQKAGFLMNPQSGKSSADGKDSKPLIISSHARDHIREIALGLFMGRNYSQFQQFCREECLFSALKVYLERHGVTCDWEVENDF